MGSYGMLGNPFAGYRTGSYDNNFSAISKIAEAFAEVMPYAVDSKGERLKETPAAVAALYNPNRQMSGVKFFETLITMALVHPTVYVLVWRKDGREAKAGAPFTPDSIAGYTFLENPSVDYQDDRIVYRTGSATYTDKDVMQISLNINPYSLLAGYSPSLAAKKWATIDDYVADYQAGFFSNGAIPEGQFIITARSAEEFNNTVDYLERKHRGAKQSGKVNYVHRVMNDAGQAGAAQIEWVPYATSNKDLTLQSIFDQTNKKIDMAFGVPEEVKGYLQNSNYASAEVADYVFARRVVYPKLIKIWGQFTHELNRITGGLGYAITFDYDLPMLSDEVKVKADAEKVRTETLLELLNYGFTLDSAVEALGLPEDYLKLAENSTSPEPSEAVEEAEAEETTVSQQETSAKRLKVANKVKAAMANPKVYAEVKAYMQKQVDAAVADMHFDTIAEAEEFSNKLWAQLEPILQEFGTRQWDEADGTIIREVGVTLPVGAAYAVSDRLTKAYKSYLKDVSLSYTNDTNASIKNVLGKGEILEWTPNELKEELRNIMNTDEWRVQRLARTETHRSEQLGGLDAMTEIQDLTGVQINKVWHVNPFTPNHCQECLDLDGTVSSLDGDFGVEFRAGMTEAASAHPNCNCYLTYTVSSVPAKSVKVCCPDCGRYLFESEGGVAKNVICTNSKCKKHLDFEIKNGKIKAKEHKDV